MRNAAFLPVLAPVLALAACAPSDLRVKQSLPLVVQQEYAAQFQDAAFDTGPVTVLVEENGDLRTYTLAPCRANTTVCAGSSGGRAGSLTWEDDHLVVRGTYAGRSFHLSPGGDGFMMRAGVAAPLAWDDPSPRTRWAQTLVTDQGVGLTQPSDR